MLWDKQGLGYLYIALDFERNQNSKFLTPCVPHITKQEKPIRTVGLELFSLLDYELDFFFLVKDYDTGMFETQTTLLSIESLCRFFGHLISVSVLIYKLNSTSYKLRFYRWDWVLISFFWISIPFVADYFRVQNHLFQGLKLGL